ncbi:MAG: hypothetical protein F6K55_22395 [Moorea sp. SIO4A3]|nr:hypothetical protein [Moorena sp. SIO4A3]NEQ79415.1 hypothetical protein [Moorena sp. SIO2I5]
MKITNVVYCGYPSTSAIAQLVNFRVIAYRYFIVNLICRQQIFRGTL